MGQDIVSKVLNGELDIRTGLGLQQGSPIDLRNTPKRDKFINVFSAVLDRINLEGIDGWVQRLYKKEFLKNDLDKLREIFEQEKRSLATAKIGGLVKTLDNLLKQWKLLNFCNESYENPGIDRAVRGMVIGNLMKLTDYSPPLKGGGPRTSDPHEKFYSLGNSTIGVKSGYGQEYFSLNKDSDKVLVVGKIQGTFPSTRIIGRKAGYAMPELKLGKEYKERGTSDQSPPRYSYIMGAPDGREILCTSEDGRKQLEIKRDRIYQAIIHTIRDDKFYGFFVNQSPLGNNQLLDVNPKLVGFNRRILLV